MKKFFALLLIVACIFLLQSAWPQLLTMLQRSSQPSPDRHLVRIAQFDRSQYASDEEYEIWHYSTCSTTTMTELANYYSDGRQYRISDLLNVQVQAKAISPQLGLLDNGGIERTLLRFHLKTDYTPRSLDQIVNLANNGIPVVVNFPPDRWKGGHILLVVGGDNEQVKLADSSQFNLKSLPRQTFLRYWGSGFIAVVTPQEGGLET